MKNLLNIIIFGILVYAVDRISAETKMCYQCQITDSPLWTDCWNASESLSTVECEGSCFTSMFQSGGNHLSNYWNVKRGCASDTECSPSENCFSQHYGACEYCCSSNLCNSIVNSSATVVGICLSIVTVCLLSILALI